MDTTSARQRRRWLETASMILLTSAGVATSWSSYQAARWGGVQATDYSRASALRLESARASSAADALRAIDIAMFAGWIEAYASGDETLRQFYQERMREEFAPALHAWLSMEPLRSSGAAKSPFELPEYRLARSEEAAELAAEAEQTFKAGQTANGYSDAYVLSVVLFAIVLLFTGMAQQFRIRPVQYALLTAAAVLLAVGARNVLALPTI